MSFFLFLVATTAWATHLDGNGPLSVPGYKLCFVGDTGTGGRQQSRVAKALAAEKCHQIRHVGDIVYESGIRSTEDPFLETRFYRPFERVFGSVFAPSIYLALGNHDYSGNEAAWLDVAAADPRVVFPSYYYSESWDRELCVLTVDTTPFDKNHGGREPQLAWLRETKRRLADECRFAIAIGHHPYWSVGDHGNATREMKKFLEEEIIGQVDLYATGHDHNLADEGVAEGTRLLVSGSGGKLRGMPRAPAPGNWAVPENGYFTLEFERDGLGVITARYQFTLVYRRKSAWWKFWENDILRVQDHAGTITGRGLRTK